MERDDAKRSNADNATPPAIDGAIECSDRLSGHANSYERSHGHWAKPAHGELKHGRGGTIQPLGIVDSDQNRRARSEASHNR
jgi:hypothetical protein